MMALSTDVLVRFLVRDDEEQAQAVFARFKQAEAAGERLFVPLTVVREMIWVLDRAYRLSRAEILDAIEDLRRMPILQFEADPVVQRVVLEGRTFPGDLADLLIARASLASGCEAVLTFDKKAAKSPMFVLLN
jgi:predicted nucleic-acid-binding protein